MRFITFVLTLILSQFSQAKALPVLTNIANLEWKNRIIIANQIENEKGLLELIRTNTKEVNERHIIWFILGPDIKTNYQGPLSDKFVQNIRQQYDLQRNEILLIGKDGGVKSRSNKMNLTGLFSEIDTMPMRRNEMKKT